MKLKRCDRLVKYMSDITQNNKLKISDDNMGEIFNNDYDNEAIDQEIEEVLKQLDEVADSDDGKESGKKNSVPSLVARPAVPVKSPSSDIESSTILLTERVAENFPAPSIDPVELDEFDVVLGSGNSSDPSEVWKDNDKERSKTKIYDPTNTVAKLSSSELADLIENAVERGIRKVFSR
jgi:hypothetical protein